MSDEVTVLFKDHLENKRTAAVNTNHSPRRTRPHRIDNCLETPGIVERELSSFSPRTLQDIKSLNFSPVTRGGFGIGAHRSSKSHRLQRCTLVS
ncbi:unnamed protein product [Pleuronectes platessa]|uniref:Uncharacterized protein n=1 Tax=Pleuronectes platessa TaxID=8262 RepID=A0A9N7VT70_PLEPL|nr:unnamed protein product [Pleuronectes platessa]